MDNFKNLFCAPKHCVTFYKSMILFIVTFNLFYMSVFMIARSEGNPFINFVIFGCGISSGMFSSAEIGRSHFGQRERGETIDNPAGHREIQTFRKEPMHSPSRVKVTRPMAGVMPGTVIVGICAREFPLRRRHSAIRLPLL